MIMIIVEANYGDYPWTALVMDTNNQLIYGLGIVVSWGLVLTTARNVQSLQAQYVRLIISSLVRIAVYVIR
jgi:hypothetical protein